MKKVFQSNDEDCFTACIASITESRLEDVPFFMSSKGWFQNVKRWLKRRGFDLVYVPHQSELDGRRYAIAAVDAFSMPDGRLVAHAVIMRGGKVVHDPDRRRIKKNYDFFNAFEVRKINETSSSKSSR